MKKLFLLFVLISSGQSCLGWGEKGHQIVAELAIGLLDSASKQKLIRILDGTTIQKAATWMDDVRSSPSYSFMSKWHYINIERGRKYDPNSKDNIISGLQDAFSQLQNPKHLEAGQLKIRIMILIHLIGDLHQPLHVGYPADKGGNNVQVTFKGKSTNLHHVWDDEIIDYQRISTRSILESCNTSKCTVPHSISKSEFVFWMEESRALLPQVYKIRGRAISSKYIRRNDPVIKSQLLKAGVRLASVLENSLKYID